MGATVLKTPTYKGAFQGSPGSPRRVRWDWSGPFRLGSAGPLEISGKLTVKQ